MPKKCIIPLVVGDKPGLSEEMRQHQYPKSGLPANCFMVINYENDQLYGGEDTTTKILSVNVKLPQQIDNINYIATSYYIINLDKNTICVAIKPVKYKPVDYPIPLTTSVLERTRIIEPDGCKFIYHPLEQGQLHAQYSIQLNFQYIIWKWLELFFYSLCLQAGLAASPQYNLPTLEHVLVGNYDSGISGVIEFINELTNVTAVNAEDVLGVQGQSEQAAVQKPYVADSEIDMVKLLCSVITTAENIHFWIKCQHQPEPLQAPSMLNLYGEKNNLFDCFSTLKTFYKKYKKTPFYLEYKQAMLIQAKSEVPLNMLNAFSSRIPGVRAAVSLPNSPQRPQHKTRERSISFGRQNMPLPPIPLDAANPVLTRGSSRFGAGMFAKKTIEPYHGDVVTYILDVLTHYTKKTPSKDYAHITLILRYLIASILADGGNDIKGVFERWRGLSITSPKTQRKVTCDAISVDKGTLNTWWKIMTISTNQTLTVNVRDYLQPLAADSRMPDNVVNYHRLVPPPEVKPACSVCHGIGQNQSSACLCEYGIASLLVSATSRLTQFSVEHEYAAVGASDHQ